MGIFACLTYSQKFIWNVFQKMDSFSTKPKSERTLRRHAQFAVQQAIQNLAQQCCDKNKQNNCSENKADLEFEIF